MKVRYVVETVNGSKHVSDDAEDTAANFTAFDEMIQDMLENNTGQFTMQVKDSSGDPDLVKATISFNVTNVVSITRLIMEG